MNMSNSFNFLRDCCGMSEVEDLMSGYLYNYQENPLHEIIFHSHLHSNMIGGNKGVYPRR